MGQYSTSLVWFSQRAWLNLLTWLSCGDDNIQTPSQLNVDYCARFDSLWVCLLATNLSGCGYGNQKCCRQAQSCWIMVIVLLSGQDLPALNMRCNPLHSGSAGSLIDRQIDAIKPKQNTRRVDHRLTLPTFCILDENIILRDTSVTDGGGCRTRTCNGSVLRRMEVLATHLICLPVYLPSHPRSLPMTLHAF